MSADKKPVTSTTDNALDSAVNEQEKKQGPSEASKHVKSFNDESGGSDSDKWKAIGGVLAAVAAITLGGIAIHKKRESSKSDRKKREAEEEASGILNEAGRKLRGSGRWIGDRAETVKDKAGQLAAAAGGVADDIGPRVQGAASSTKDKVSDSLPSGVKNAAGSVSERANIAGIKAEREGLKASERSDAAVRDAADKVLHVTDKAARKADRQSGGFFSGIRNWLADRKDDAVDAVDNVADRIKEN